jgi:hypothetical protein
MTTYQTELECLHCGTTTVQTVIYASLYIKKISCNSCLYSIEQPTTKLMRQYGRDLPWRAFALAKRLKSEAIAHPLVFAFSLPKRVLHKPIELSRELVEVCL